MNKILYIVGILAVLITGTMILINATTEPVLAEETVQTAPQCEWTVLEAIVDTPETESATEAITESSETIAETELSTESSTTLYYNVNLPEYVQDVIFAECEKYGIEPAIVIAMIERESHFDRYAIGDDGRALGLMQVLPKHHLKRMISLGCTDLFDPIQNVTVGIDYLAECYDRYGSIDKALVAYNSGSYSGTITNYALDVLMRANKY